MKLKELLGLIFSGGIIFTKKERDDMNWE